MKKTFYFLCITLLFLSCARDKTLTGYMNKVRQNLAKIESATYTKNYESWMPGDTVPHFSGSEYIEYYLNSEGKFRSEHSNNNKSGSNPIEV